MALLLYTPGLIGGRGTTADTSLGTDGLIDLVADERDTDPVRLLERLVERAQQLNGGPLVDDVATLLLSPDSTPADTAPGPVPRDHPNAPEHSLGNDAKVSRC